MPCIRTGLIIFQDEQLSRNFERSFVLQDALLTFCPRAVIIGRSGEIVTRL